MAGGESFLEKHHFLLRRLHSLTGIVPIGVFLIAHLTTNSSVLWGALNKRAEGYGTGEPLDRGVATFQHEVYFINDLPFVLLIEIFGLWLPIALHAGLGMVYAFTGKANVGRYAYRDNWRYTLQRWSGYVGLLYIIYHVGTLRWGWSWLTPADTAWSHEFASSTLVAALRGDGGEWEAAGILVALLYFVGVFALVFHFANGMWTAAITWGVTITAEAQRRWGYICLLLGVGLAGAGALAWGGFFFAVDYERALEVETEMYFEKYGKAPSIEEFNLPGLREAIERQRVSNLTAVEGRNP